MLISGKSGTISPIIACSSTGQFCHDGSWQWHRRMWPSPSEFQLRTLRRASLRPSRPRPRGRPGEVDGDCAFRQVRRDRTHQAQRLQHFFETHGRRAPPRRRLWWIAMLTANRVRCPRMVDAQIDGLCRWREPARPHRPSCAAQLRRDLSGTMKRSCSPACSS